MRRIQRNRIRSIRVHPRRRNRIAVLVRSPGTPFGWRVMRNRRLYTRKIKHRHHPKAPGQDLWSETGAIH
jgi:hypothetical protein